MGTIITVLGTRPEIIRLSLIIKRLDALPVKHILVHTGQNYDANLNDIFFNELGLRKPDYYLGATGSLGEQLATMLTKLEDIIAKEKPNKALILGDTNSGLTTIIFERLGIHSWHMEAGNRCRDLEVPEEVNRKLIDSIATYNLPYTSGSRENLMFEGKEKSKVIVTGNPIYEVIMEHIDAIKNSSILKTLNIFPRNYFLATFHRTETVDYMARMSEIIKGLLKVKEKYGLPVICSIHPRTRDKISKFGIAHDGLTFLKPLGFFDFVHLEKFAKCVLSDSGTVSEETCILHTPNVIIRNTTERPETIKCGSSMLSGINSEKILTCTELMSKGTRTWELPEGYLDNNVSEKVVKIIFSK